MRFAHYLINNSIVGPTHCDVNNPNSRDTVDCHRFYHCKDTAEGPELVEKTCGPYMMYNHEKQVCDWPATVIALRPECAGAYQLFIIMLIISDYLQNFVFNFCYCVH
jgi:Chitin binding Peritrophin-A domain.